MLAPLTQDTLDDYLTAFADGELDVAQTLAMWSFLETHPDRAAAVNRIQAHQQLTSAARRTLRTTAPPDVRDRMAAMIDAQPVADATARHEGEAITTSVGFWRRRVKNAVSVAAGIAIGVTATAFALRPTSPHSVIPGELVAKVGRVHAECSRLPAAMHDATFESVDATLASTMKTIYNGTTAAPDLTAAGFRFVGAGPCHGAGPKTVHLLYRSADPHSVSAISLFVQSDVGQYSALAADRVYRVSSPTSPFPTLAWRKDKVICVLLADSDKTESVVLQIIRPIPADEIVVIAAR